MESASSRDVIGGSKMEFGRRNSFFESRRLGENSWATWRCSKAGDEIQTRFWLWHSLLRLAAEELEELADGWEMARSTNIDCRLVDATTHEVGAKVIYWVRGESFVRGM